MTYAHALFGAYLDALGGLRTIRDNVTAFQKEKIEELKATDPTNATEAYMDAQFIGHQFESNEGKASNYLHQSTQGEFKRRTAEDGQDARLLGYMMVALLYGAWEDEYRAKLANALNYATPREVKSDLFGDVAQLRHAIVHHSGVATKDVESAKVLKWFKRGDQMLINLSHVNCLYHEVDAFITRLCGIPPDWPRERDSQNKPYS